MRSLYLLTYKLLLKIITILTPTTIQEFYDFEQLEMKRNYNKLNEDYYFGDY